MSGASSVAPPELAASTRIRNLTFVPICGASCGGSGGSIAILFHTDGGTASTTSSASSVVARRERDRAPLLASRSTRCTVVRSTHARLADAFERASCASCWLPPRAAVDLAVGPVLLDAAALHHREVAEIALPLGAHAVVGRHLRIDGRACRAARRRGRRSTTASDRLSSASAFGRLPRLDRRPTFAASAFIMLSAGVHLLPELLASFAASGACRRGRSGASASSSSVTSRNSSLKLLRVGDPGRMVRADQLAAAFDVLARARSRGT